MPKPAPAEPAKAKRGGESLEKAAAKKAKVEVDKLGLEAAVVADRAVAVFHPTLETATTKDEVVEFAKHCAGFLPGENKSPFAAGDDTSTKSDAAQKTANWIAAFAKKTHLEEVAAIKSSSVRCITALTKWFWDHKLRKKAVQDKKWVKPDLNSAEKLAEFLCPSGNIIEPAAAAAAAAAAPAAKKPKVKKPRKSEPAAPKAPRKSRQGLVPLPTDGLVPLGTAPMSGGKVVQELYTDSPALADQMLQRVRQGAQKFQKKEPTGPTARPPFSFVTDKSPAREAPIESFAVKADGIRYKHNGTEIRHQFSPAALRTLYEKDATYCGPPSGGTLAQTSPIGNVNKAVEGLTRAMRAGQQPGSRMQPTAGVTLVATTQKEDGVDKPRYGSIYLFEGGDPGGKETYTQKFNFSDSKAPLKLKGETFPVVNMEVDTSATPAAEAAAAPLKPDNDGMDTVHVRALIAETVAAAQAMLGLEPARIIAMDEDAGGLPESATALARNAIHRLNKAVVGMGLLTSSTLLPPS